MKNGRVAELVDALASGASEGNLMEVQILSRPQASTFYLERAGVDHCCGRTCISPAVAGSDSPSLN